MMADGRECGLPETHSCESLLSAVEPFMVTVGTGHRSDRARQSYAR